MWVIVMESIEGNSRSESKLKLFLKNNKFFNVTKFSNYNKLLEEYKFKCGIKITHWNAMTGNFIINKIMVIIKNTKKINIKNMYCKL